MLTKEEILNKLKTIIDPEIGINIVDLGLIYDLQIKDDNVAIKMTVTAPHCPMRAYFLEKVKEEVKKIKGVKEAKVELVCDPPWTPEKMSPEARKKLGI